MQILLKWIQVQSQTLILLLTFLTAGSVLGQVELLGHWPLIDGAEDVTPNSRHGKAQHVKFTQDGAVFNGPDPIHSIEKGC